MLNGFCCKIFSTKLFSEKNNFFENIFRRLASMKKLRNAKMQLSSESGNVRLPLPNSDVHIWQNLAIYGQTPLDRSNLARSVAESVQIQPDFHHGQIPASFGQNLLRRHPATVAGCRQILVPAVVR
jgi:hypothetical protein